MRRAHGTLVIGAALLFGAGPMAGQEAEPDGRWLPYLGCWVEVSAPAGPMTCVIAEEGGVALLTVADGVAGEARILADGREQPADVAGCTGSEAAAFSEDGRRVYTRSTLVCGQGTERSVRGLIAMVEQDEWIEVRALDADGEAVAWVKRYRPAPPRRVAAAGLSERVSPDARPLEAARIAASAPITVDDVIEAVARTDAEAVRAWVLEQGDPLRLDADRLIRLAEAGVPESVIDVAVAVSFPEHFDVARTPRPGTPSYGYPVGTWGWSPFRPHYRDPFYGLYGYNRYGYGYGPGFWGPGYYGGTPTVVVVNPVSSSSSGRVVNGRGYTSGSSATGPTASRPSIRSRGPSSSRAGSGGYRGSSGSGSREKAKPRGGG